MALYENLCKTLNTDVFSVCSLQMVGVGTSEVNLDKFKFSFGSLLGHDEDSWGLSYTGSTSSC